MKKLIFTAMLLGAALAGYSQGSTLPYSNSTETYSQMWNIASTYFGTASASNLGTQKDTTAGVTPLFLYVSRFNAYSSSASDTFTLSPALGIDRAMTFTVAAYQSISSDSLTVTFQESADGIIWKNCGQTSGTGSVTSTVGLKPTSGTVPVVAEVILPTKYERFYRAQIVGTSAKASRVQCWYHMIKKSALCSSE